MHALQRPVADTLHSMHELHSLASDVSGHAAAAGAPTRCVNKVVWDQRRSAGTALIGIQQRLCCHIVVEVCCGQVGLVGRTLQVHGGAD